MQRLPKKPNPPDASPHLVLPGHCARADPRRCRAIPDLEPGPRRDLPETLRLEHPPERQVLPYFPGGHALRHRDRPLLHLLAGLEADPERPRALDRAA